MRSSPFGIAFACSKRGPERRRSRRESASAKQALYTRSQARPRTSIVRSWRAVGSRRRRATWVGAFLGRLRDRGLRSPRFLIADLTVFTSGYYVATWTGRHGGGVAWLTRPEGPSLRHLLGVSDRCFLDLLSPLGQVPDVPWHRP